MKGFGVFDLVGLFVALLIFAALQPMMSSTISGITGVGTTTTALLNLILPFIVIAMIWACIARAMPQKQQ